MPSTSSTSVPEAVVAGIQTVRGCGRDLMLVSCVDDEGSVGPSQSFDGRGSADPYAEAFEFVVFAGAKAAVIVTHFRRLILEYAQALVLTNEIEKQGRSFGVNLLVHAVTDTKGAWVLVRDPRVDAGFSRLS